MITDVVNNVATTENVSPNVQIWLGVMSSIVAIAALIIPPILNKRQKKPGINGNLDSDENTPTEPKPPVFKPSGELDEVASFLDMYDNIKRMHRDRTRDAAKISQQDRQILTMQLEMQHNNERFATAVQQVFTWAINLHGNPPHPVPAWVQEIVDSARALGATRKSG